jgi:hypothetical protein
MANRQPVNSDGRVVDLLERFLDYHHQNSAPATYQFYVAALNSLAPLIGNLRVSDLKPHHVYDWIDRNHRTVQRRTSREAAITACQNKGLTPLGDGL